MLKRGFHQKNFYLLTWESSLHHRTSWSRTPPPRCWQSCCYPSWRRLGAPDNCVGSWYPPIASGSLSSCPTAQGDILDASVDLNHDGGLATPGDEGHPRAQLVPHPCREGISPEAGVSKSCDYSNLKQKSHSIIVNCFMAIALFCCIWWPMAIALFCWFCCIWFLAFQKKKQEIPWHRSKMWEGVWEKNKFHKDIELVTYWWGRRG